MAECDPCAKERKAVEAVEKTLNRLNRPFRGKNVKWRNLTELFWGNLRDTQESLKARRNALNDCLARNASKTNQR